MSDLYKPLVKSAIRNLEHYKRKIQRFTDEIIKDIEADIADLKTDVQSTQDYYDVYPQTKSYASLSPESKTKVMQGIKDANDGNVEQKDWRKSDK